MAGYAGRRRITHRKTRRRRSGGKPGHQCLPRAFWRSAAWHRGHRCSGRPGDVGLGSHERRAAFSVQAARMRVMVPVQDARRLLIRVQLVMPPMLSSVARPALRRRQPRSGAPPPAATGRP